MESITSLRDLKAEASTAVGRGPHRGASKRDRRPKAGERDDGLDVDTFEHVDGEPEDS
jgi:hypothetical protein